jgi:protein translocase SecG subunit
LLTYAHIGISVLLIISILLQQRGGGLSSTFGGGMMEYSTKRGAEKIIFYASIVLTVLFLGVSVARLLL